MNIGFANDLPEKIAEKWTASGTKRSSATYITVLRTAILLVGASVVAVMLGLTVVAYMSGKAPNLFPPEVLQLLG